MNINAFSDEQIAGQRLMVGFDGIALDNDLMFLIDTLKVGGIILFSRNISDPDQISELCVSVQQYAKSCGQPPLFIAIDQEGGTVARLKEPFTQFPGNPMIKNLSDAEHFARVTAFELAQVGINMNFAPVLDVSPVGIQSIMEKRIFGHDPKWVSDLGVTVIRYLQENGIMASAKHFPGIGRTRLDSHLDMPILDASMSDLESSDLLPFASAINYGVATVMLSHIRYNQIDPDFPASLSYQIAKELLRDQMGFDNIVITDDLDMGAIKKYFDIQTIIRQILCAEIDIALICHTRIDMENAFEEILSSLKASQKINIKGKESVQRIMNLKTAFIN